MATGWQGERVRLVPLDKERHLANCVQWFSDPQVTAWTLTGDYPVTRLFEEEFFERVMLAGKSAHPEILAFAVETLEGEHVGMTGLHDINFRHGFATTGSLIGRTDLWGQGLGSDAIRVRTRYAFDVLGLRLLLSEVFDGNTRSYRALTRCGYREVGRVPRKFWKRGAYRDLILLICERETWTGAPAGDSNVMA